MVSKKAGQQKWTMRDIDSMLTPREKADVTESAKRMCLMNDGARVDMELLKLQSGVDAGLVKERKEEARVRWQINEVMRFREMGPELLLGMPREELMRIMAEEGITAEPVQTDMSATPGDIAMIRRSLID